MLKGKCVVLGVTGSIAAYKIAYLASALVKQHADVHVIMTENACQFITPVTFETLTGNKCMVDTFDRNFQFHVAHVSLAKKADVVLIAPASANVIQRLNEAVIAAAHQTKSNAMARAAWDPPSAHLPPPAQRASHSVSSVANRPPAQPIRWRGLPMLAGVVVLNDGRCAKHSN